MLGIRREGHLLVGVELGGGIEQSQDSGMNQIVQIDVHREVFMHAHSDCFYQRQVFEYDAIANVDLDFFSCGALGLLHGVTFLLERRCQGVLSGLNFGSDALTDAHRGPVAGEVIPKTRWARFLAYSFALCPCQSNTMAGSVAGLETLFSCRGQRIPPPHVGFS